MIWSVSYPSFFTFGRTVVRKSSKDATFSYEYKNFPYGVLSSPMISVYPKEKK